MHAFVQASVDFGPTAYGQIAAVVGMSEADVRAYADVFWKRGPWRCAASVRRRAELPGFEKILERMEKSRTRRAEIQSYRELAAQKVCSYANPFAMELAGWRPQLFSYDGDVFLVCCVRAARRREA